MVLKSEYLCWLKEAATPDLARFTDGPATVFALRPEAAPSERRPRHKFLCKECRAEGQYNVTHAVYPAEMWRQGRQWDDPERAVASPI